MHKRPSTPVFSSAQIEWDETEGSPLLQTVECPCGADMIPMKRPLAMAPAGLPHIIFEDAPALECARCGNRKPEVSNPEVLAAVAAGVLVRRPGRLSGNEIRFLREWMGLQGLEFAELLHVSNVSVSRWETGASPIAAGCEEILRAHAAGMLMGFRPLPSPSATELWLGFLRQGTPPRILTIPALVGNALPAGPEGVRIPYPQCHALLATDLPTESQS